MKNLEQSWPRDQREAEMTKTITPPLTIGLPVYNGERYLKSAIVSLLHQTFTDFELIISDNGSTDRTPKIVQALQLRDARIVFHRNSQNIGAAANFNLVARRAAGTFFAWANHDDLWAPTYFERCIATLSNDDSAVLCYTKSAKISGDGTLVAELRGDLGITDARANKRLRRYHDHFIAIDRRNGWSGHEIEGLWMPVYGVIRTEVLKRTDLIGTYISSDTVLLEQLAAYGKFLEIDEALFFKRDHEDRSMRDSLAYDNRWKWFTGQDVKVFLFPRLQILYKRLRAIGNATLPPQDKALCLVEMLAFYVRRPHESKAIVKELLVNAGRAVAHVLNRRLRLPQKW